MIDLIYRDFQTKIETFCRLIKESWFWDKNDWSEKALVYIKSSQMMN